MSCEETTNAIMAALDGELAPEERAALEKHLAGCTGCAALAADLRAMRAAAPGLVDDVGPGNWAALSRALEAGGTVRRKSWPRRFWPALAAAALLLATLSTVLVMRHHPADEDARARLELGRLETQQRRALSALEELVAHRRVSWDPKLRDTFARSTAQVDAALQDCRRALRRAPGDVALRANLAEAYQRKVELLRLFSGVDEEGTR